MFFAFLVSQKAGSVVQTIPHFKISYPNSRFYAPKHIEPMCCFKLHSEVEWNWYADIVKGHICYQACILHILPSSFMHSKLKHLCISPSTYRIFTALLSSLFEADSASEGRGNTWVCTCGILDYSGK